MGQLEEMSVFVRIVEAGGIGKAADQLSYFLRDARPPGRAPGTVALPRRGAGQHTEPSP